MAQFLFVYHGGGKPDSPEAESDTMAAWGRWFESIGDRIVDGGKPVGASTTVNSDGSVDNHGGANPTTGYGLFEAADLDAAIEIARGCPILADGGSVEVAETFAP